MKVHKWLPVAGAVIGVGIAGALRHDDPNSVSIHRHYDAKSQALTDISCGASEGRFCQLFVRDNGTVRSVVFQVGEVDKALSQVSSNADVCEHIAHSAQGDSVSPPADCKFEKVA